MIDAFHFSGVAGDCGNSSFAWVFLALYFMLSTQFALSILSAVIVENFSICSFQDHAIFSRISWSDFETFRAVWMLFDPYGRGRLGIDLIDSFVIMMGRIHSPLGDCNASPLYIACLKLYASRMAAMDINDNDLTWETLLKTHKKSGISDNNLKALHGPVDGEDLKQLVRERSQAKQYISFRGLLFCLALFKVEESCLTYSESLVKCRIIEFVQRKVNSKTSTPNPQPPTPNPQPPTIMWCRQACSCSRPGPEKTLTARRLRRNLATVSSMYTNAKLRPAASRPHASLVAAVA